MNKNIMKLVIPAIMAGIGLANTGCVATRCYETYPTSCLETTYVATPVVETVYVEHPVGHYVTPPPPRHHVTPPRKPAPRPKAKPAQRHHQAKAAPKAKPAQQHHQAKAKTRPARSTNTRPKKPGAA